MADPRFFDSKGPFDLHKVIALTEASLAPGQSASQDDLYQKIYDLEALSQAGNGHLTFFENPKYLDEFKSCRATACFVHPNVLEKIEDFQGLPLLLVHKKPRRAYAVVANAFYPDKEIEAGVSDRAMIDHSAKIGKGVSIASGAVIEENVEIGDHTAIDANAVIKQGVKIGARCRIGAGCVISHALIGDDVSMLRNVSVGQRGFGFDPSPEGHLNVPQLGRVLIGNDVEIGAGTTIDRGAGPDTIIGDGCRIDNLVQVGHNAQLDKGCVLVSQVGISGSTKVGKFVTFAGQSGSAGHLTVGDGVTVAAKSGVTNDVSAGQTVAGFPAVPVNIWRKQVVALKRLVKKS